MKRRWAVSLAIFAMAAATYVWLRDGGRSVRLKDGSVLSVAGIRYGQTNEFVQGTFGQRTFGRFLRRGGIALFGFKFAPPERYVFSHTEGPQMDIMFRLENAN